MQLNCLMTNWPNNCRIWSPNWIVMEMTTIKVQDLPVQATVRKKVVKVRPKPKNLRIFREKKTKNWFPRFVMPIPTRLLDSNWVDLHRVGVRGKVRHVRHRWVRVFERKWIIPAPTSFGLICLNVLECQWMRTPNWPFACIIIQSWMSGWVWLKRWSIRELEMILMWFLICLRKKQRITMMNWSKWHNFFRYNFSILAFSSNFCPTKLTYLVTLLTAEIGPFLAFLMNFCLLKM